MKELLFFSSSNFNSLLTPFLWVLISRSNENKFLLDLNMFLSILIKSSFGFLKYGVILFSLFLRFDLNLIFLLLLKFGVILFNFKLNSLNFFSNSSIFWAFSLLTFWISFWISFSICFTNLSILFWYFSIFVSRSNILLFNIPLFFSIKTFICLCLLLNWVWNLNKALVMIFNAVFSQSSNLFLLCEIIFLNLLISSIW